MFRYDISGLVLQSCSCRSKYCVMYSFYFYLLSAWCTLQNHGVCIGRQAKKKNQTAMLTWAESSFLITSILLTIKEASQLTTCACIARLHLLFLHVKSQGHWAVRSEGIVSQEKVNFTPIYLYCHSKHLQMKLHLISWLPSSAVVSLSQSPSCNQAVIQPV